MHIKSREYMENYADMVRADTGFEPGHSYFIEWEIFYDKCGGEKVDNSMGERTYIVITPNGRPLLHVNKFANAYKQRFIYAQAIGAHYLFRGGLGILISSLNTKEWEETVLFAQAYVMPRNTFIHQWKRKDDLLKAKVDRLSFYFKVEEDKICVRAQRLGLL